MTQSKMLISSLMRNLVRLIFCDLKTYQALTPGVFRTASLRISSCEREMDFQVVGFKLERPLQMVYPILDVPGFDQGSAKYELCQCERGVVLHGSFSVWYCVQRLISDQRRPCENRLGGCTGRRHLRSAFELCHRLVRVLRKQQVSVEIVRVGLSGEALKQVQKRLLCFFIVPGQ